MRNPKNPKSLANAIEEEKETLFRRFRLEEERGSIENYAYAVSVAIDDVLKASARKKTKKRMVRICARLNRDLKIKELYFKMPLEAQRYVKATRALIGRQILDGKIALDFIPLPYREDNPADEMVILASSDEQP